MRPFEPTEYPLMWSGSAYGASRHRRTFYPFGGGGGPVAAKRQPTLYMVPMTPSKPAFLMKPTGVPPNSHQQAPFSSDYSRFFNCSNNLTSNSLMNSYATANRFERLPAINGCSNFQPVCHFIPLLWSTLLNLPTILCTHKIDGIFCQVHF